MTKLVLVESAAKVKSIQTILDTAYGKKQYKVAATLGHLRDLPSGEIGIDIANNFAPRYVLLPAKRKTVAYLRKLLKTASALYLASDPDREGEAIAWHCVEVLQPKCPVFRVTFNAITEPAVKTGFANARQVDMNRVQAQEARRILDRLVGFAVSAALWAALNNRNLSAGRVQSVALHLVVERQREIDAFQPQHGWFIHADFTAENGTFCARLVQWQGVEIDMQTFSDQAAADAVVAALQHTAFTVASVHYRNRQRQPHAPFITATLQQAASSHLDLSPARTMKLAQKLYEIGAITYMRTDSPQVAPAAYRQAAKWILGNYGDTYLPRKPNRYAARSGAQAGHECIRPTDIAIENLQHVSEVRLQQLYTLIRDRFIASQMTAAHYRETLVTITGAAAVFTAHAIELQFDGFLRVYAYPETDTSNVKAVQSLPLLLQDEVLPVKFLYTSQHTSQPPKHYSEASLVQALERQGVGRPSTFAAMVTTIQQRGCVRRKKKQLVPTELGCAVLDYLLAHFAPLFDVTFTAQLEAVLDFIAAGEMQSADFLAAFWHDFAPLLETLPALEKLQSEPLNIACPDCGAQLLARTGKYGRFIGCSAFPTCRYARSLEEDESA
jgi:DNA topoisomerase-1